MLTKVQCVEESNETKQQTNGVKISEKMKKLLYLHGQSQKQLDHMFTLRNVLKKQFLNTLGVRLTESIFTKVLIHIWLNEEDQINEHPQRMLIDEFLNTPHKCPLIGGDMVTGMFTTVADLKNSIPEVSTDEMEWKYSKQISQQVLVGIIDVSNSTGQIVLYDDTGSIDFVTCCYHDRINEPCSHLCEGPCDCNNIEIGDTFLCPYVHTCCVGKIVALKMYQIICETMVTSNGENFKFLSRTERSRSDACDKYLVVDMKNVVYIGNNPEVGPSKSEQKVSNGVKELSAMREENANIKLVCHSEQDIYCGRESLSSDHVKCKNEQTDGVTSVKINTELSKSEISLDFKKSSLHKHVKKDGSIVFCRKVECCDKSSMILNRNNLDPSLCDGNSNGGIISEINVLNEYDENHPLSSGSETVKTNNLPFKLGKSAFKVKPISNRKRAFVGNHSGIKSDSVSNKMPRIDDGKLLDKGNVRDNREVEHEYMRGNLHGNHSDSSDDRYNHDSSHVTIYIENKGSLMCADGQRRFNVDCAIINRPELEKVILEFSGKSIKWYPLLYIGTIYILSTHGEPVLSVSLSHDKLKKMLLKNKSRRCLTVNENVCITRQWNNSPQSDTLSSPCLVSLQDILKPEFTEKFVSFEGQIISRTFVKPGIAQKSMSKDLNSGYIYSRLHVQDVNGSEDIWVYLNDRNIVCEKGLTPGYMVRFYGLERKLSQLNNIYTRLVPLSCVQILFSQSERGEARNELDVGLTDTKKQFPVLSLVDLWTTSTPGQVFQCVCDIEKILKVSLKCVCEICGSLVVHSQCTNTACSRGESYRFLARASAIVDDSTSVAMVTLTGSSVQSMLQLSHDQWKCLEEEVSKTGEVFVQQFNPSLTTCLERFVYRLCDNHSVKQTWLLTMRSRSSLDINKIGHDEFCMKTFDTGSSKISTQCLPFLHLECITMSTFEPLTWAIHHLNIKS
ncbi:uncharacterized protein LOC132723363 isoform X2 [Ruditapes philippinarum]|uniref:uncharacterized protein LOC132723363 isoform X2 n=1 Tax=Ruditapes philippinarum TaxID=129788 RepID=UPI00295A5BB4|nr:uncharacterized protein LOC132723363 isoform X2 [Ruditapes philippinarum]